MPTVIRISSPIFEVNISLGTMEALLCIIFFAIILIICCKNSMKRIWTEHLSKFFTWSPIQKSIRRNIEYLVENTDYYQLTVVIFEQEILNMKAINEIDKLAISPEERHHKLIKQIIHSGSDATEKFTEALKEYFPVAYEILDEDLSSMVSSSNNKELEEYLKPLQPNIDFVVSQASEIGRDNKKGVYKMDSLNRGVLFFINIIKYDNDVSSERKGAEFDRDNFIHFFKEMGFKVFYYENITAAEFKGLVNKLIKLNYLKEVDCLVVSIMSHGKIMNSRQKVQFSDGTLLDVKNDVLMKFSSYHCPALVDKPKIFFFPFCRGIFEDCGMISSSRIQTDSVGIKRTPMFSDMMICYGSCPGYATYRNIDEGSYYVKILCQLWSINAHNTHLVDLLDLLTDQLKHNTTINKYGVQVCCYQDWGFDKQLYFNPGIYIKEHIEVEIQTQQDLK